MILAAADAIKAVAAELDGIAVENGKPQVFVGIQDALPSTPAVEVIPSSMQLSTFAAGAHQQLVTGVFFVGFAVAVTKNLEADERTLLPIVEAFVDELRDPAFDRTLGGVVEDVRAVGIEFDIVVRNNRSYRAALVELVLGDDLEG